MIDWGTRLRIIIISKAHLISPSLQLTALRCFESSMHCQSCFVRKAALTKCFSACASALSSNARALKACKGLAYTVLLQGGEMQAYHNTIWGSYDRHQLTQCSVNQIFRNGFACGSNDWLSLVNIYPGLNAVRRVKRAQYYCCVAIGRLSRRSTLGQAASNAAESKLI